MGGPSRGSGEKDAKYIYAKVVDGELVEAVILVPVCSPKDIPP